MRFLIGLFLDYYPVRKRTVGRFNAKTRAPCPVPRLAENCVLPRKGRKLTLKVVVPNGQGQRVR